MKHHAMNRRFLLVPALLALLLSPIAAHAQERVARPHSLLRSGFDNAITVQPIDLFTGNINLEYERALASRVGLYAGLNFLVMRGLLLPQETRQRLAIGPELGLRIYLIGRAPGGLWVGPYVNAAYVRDTSPGDGFTRDALALGAGGMAGLNLLFGQFMLSLGAGAGYQDYGVGVGNRTIPGTYGVTPRLRLAIGAVF